MRHGEWRERETGLGPAAYIPSRKPLKIAFHLPAWLSYFISLSKIAAIYLKAKSSGLMKDWQEFQNQYCAQPYVPEIARRAEDSILALCDEWPRGAVPGPLDGKPRAACLLAGVDTQKSHFRWIFRAFGFGRAEESWLVAAGSAGSFEALDQILWQSEWTDAEGRSYQVRAAMIDAMGSRTSEVYRYAIANRGRVFPWQGVRSAVQPYTPSPQEYFPDDRGGKIRIPGGINLWRCDTTFFKNDLAHKLSIHPDDPGAFHLHSNEKNELEEYAREMCAEVFDEEKLTWENPGKKANHFWDCEVMALALAYIMNVRATAPEQPKPARRRTEKLRGRDSLEARLGRLPR